MRVTVRLPLTLAIMDGMSVGVSGESLHPAAVLVVESFQVTSAACIRRSAAPAA